MMLIVDVWYDIDIDHANIESMKSYILTNLTLFQNIFEVDWILQIFI